MISGSCSMVTTSKFLTALEDCTEVNSTSIPVSLQSTAERYSLAASKARREE
jgi:hypothetical protein